MLKSTGCFILALLVFIKPAKTQTFEKQIGEQQWHLMETLDGFVSGHGEETFALYEIPKEGFGILLPNTKGQVKWKTAIKERPFIIARLENKIVVLTGDKTGFSVGVNNINAVLIDPETGKILLQKTILSANKSNLVVPAIYSSETGKFLKIGLRYANDSKGAKAAIMGRGVGKLHESGSQITKAEVLSFDKNMDLTNTQNLQFSTTNLLEGGSGMDPDGNILYAGYNKDNNEVIIYRFPDGKAVPDKQMKVNVTVKKLELIKDMQLLAGKKQSSIAYFIANYKNEEKDYVYEIHRLDFNTGVKTMASDILDKKYRKELEARPVNSFKGVRKPDLDDIDDLKLTGIIEVDGKVIVCKDTEHSESSISNTYMYAAGNGIISVYGNDMKKLNDNIIPKKYKSYLPFGLGIGLHVKDGNAYFVANDSEAGYMKARVLFGKIDISSGNIISVEHLVKDDIAGAEPADTQNIIGFKDKVM